MSVQPSFSFTSTNTGYVFNATGNRGQKGDDGDTGPNSVTTSTTTALTGLLAGDGSTVYAATAAQTRGLIGLAGVSTATADGDPVDLYVGGTTPGNYREGGIYLWDSADEVYGALFFAEGRLRLNGGEVELGPRYGGYIPAPTAQDYILDPYTEVATDRLTIRQIATAAGTLTAAVLVNGVAVAGWDAISVTTTPQNVTLGAAVTFPAGAIVVLRLSSVSSATGFRFSLPRAV